MNDETIAGRYELGERLGFGGMSTVQLAFDRRLERNVAVKLLAEHLADDANFVSRFRREALAAARLVHPNIVQVFDFGLDEPSDRHYIVMEHIRGQSGAQILKDQSPMPVDDALALADGACRGLAYAHRHGVVHRDVKPGNLMRSEDGVVKLADFGIAKATDSAAITQAGSVLGTAAYLAPEQAHGEEAGPRTDIYALGVVAYQLVTGRLPYDASSLTELALKQQSEIPPRADEVNPEVSPQLAAAIERALALDPHERWDSADDMRQGFAAAARGEGPLPTDPTQAINQDDTAATRMAAVATPPHRFAPHAPRTGEERVPPPSRRRPEPQRKRNRPRIAALALAAALVVAAVVAIATTGGGGSSQSVETREITEDDTPGVVDQLEGLVDDNVAD